MTTLDRAALTQGAWVSLVFAVPFSVGSSLLAGNEGSSPWVAVLWLAALVASPSVPALLRGHNALATR